MSDSVAKPSNTFFACAANARYHEFKWGKGQIKDEGYWSSPPSNSRSVLDQRTGKIYIIDSDYTFTASGERLICLSGRSSKLRYSHSLAIFNGIIYVSGGTEAPSHMERYFIDHDSYQHSSSSLENWSEMKSSHCNHVSLIVEGLETYLYIFCGSDPETKKASGIIERISLSVDLALANWEILPVQTPFNIEYCAPM